MDNTNRKYYIKAIFDIFLSILAWNVLASAIFITIFFDVNEVALSVYFLWELVAIAFLCALGSVLIYGDREKHGKTEAVLRPFLAFLYVDALYVIGGSKLGWFHIKGMQIIILEILIIAGFLFVTFYNYHRDLQQAKQINARLKMRNGE